MKDQRFLIGIMISQMTIGAFATIIFKYQSLIQVEGRDFNHPFNQVLFMFIGEAFCYIVFQIYKKINYQSYKKELKIAIAKNLKININPTRVLILAVFDLFTSCFAFFSLQLMPTSVYQMIRGATIIVTAIFQVIFLRKKLHLYQIIGMSLILIGNVVVGVFVYINQKDSANNMMLLGILFLVASFFTFSTQLILEEKYFNQYYLNPFELVGLEGIWGILLSSVLIAMLQYMPCPKSIAKNCPSDANGVAYFEQTDIFFKQVFSVGETYQPQLAIAVISGVFGILLLNALSMSVTKYLSALTRNVIQVSTIVVVWLCTLILGWEDFIIGQLIGFIILTLGSLIYGTIIQLPFAPVPTQKSSPLLLSQITDTQEQSVKQSI